MRQNPVDDRTANRLLAGTVTPDDAPPGLAGVAALLSAARPEPASGELANEAATVAAMSSVVTTQPTSAANSQRQPMLAKILSAKVAAVAAAVLLSATGAAAATGSLPDSAQQTASDALAKVGISVPAPNDHAGEHPGSRGKSAEHKNSHADDGTTHDTTGPNAHAHFGQCTAQAASAGHPNGNSPVVSATDCTNVTHPGNGDDNGGDNGNKPADPGSQGDDHSHASTPGGPPSSTPGSDHAHETTPNHGDASDGANSTGSDASSSGSGNADHSGDHGRP